MLMCCTASLEWGLNSPVNVSTNSSGTFTKTLDRMIQALDKIQSEPRSEKETHHFTFLISGCDGVEEGITEDGIGYGDGTQCYGDDFLTLGPSIKNREPTEYEKEASLKLQAERHLQNFGLELPLKEEWILNPHTDQFYCLSILSVVQPEYARFHDDLFAFRQLQQSVEKMKGPKLQLTKKKYRRQKCFRSRAGLTLPRTRSIRWRYSKHLETIDYNYGHKQQSVSGLGYLRKDFDSARDDSESGTEQNSPANEPVENLTQERDKKQDLKKHEDVSKLSNLLDAVTRNLHVSIHFNFVIEGWYPEHGSADEYGISVGCLYSESSTSVSRDGTGNCECLQL
ncbi:hypothetical protein BD410DRAFT_800073 [Rickenella mellea]|uniref:Uncharacterized protein n=1 Tax=Rickenella mellea TaxID=50990 RepID=A0A4Y7QH66_9AGAM|nr:hypothetical protein BD410DRAFT_800073 [Rickenella mellea]